MIVVIIWNNINININKEVTARFPAETNADDWRIFEFIRPILVLALWISQGLTQAQFQC